MNTLQLIDALKKRKFVRRTFCGVIPIDLLGVKKINKNCSFIVNTDDSSKPGEHWFAIYMPKNLPVEFFDSYGIKPKQKEILEFIRFNGKRYKYNDKRIQGNNSINCGLFALFFIYFRAKGYTMEQFLKLFTNNYLNNDLIVKKLYNKIVYLK